MVDGEELMLEKVEVKDAGVYECVAHNHLSRVVTSVQVLVEGLASF